MKMHPRIYGSLTILVVTVLLLSVSACFGQEAAMAKERWENIPADAPAEKVELWKARRNIVEKEYDVCLEHCGYEKSCENRCQETLKKRMFREYALLFGKAEPGQDK